MPLLLAASNGDLDMCCEACYIAMLLREMQLAESNRIVVSCSAGTATLEGMQELVRAFDADRSQLYLQVAEHVRLLHSVEYLDSCYTPHVELRVIYTFFAESGSQEVARALSHLRGARKARKAAVGKV